jgi:hypothetical protein
VSRAGEVTARVTSAPGRSAASQLARLTAMPGWAPPPYAPQALCASKIVSHAQGFMLLCQVQGQDTLLPLYWAVQSSLAMRVMFSLRRPVCPHQLDGHRGQCLGLHLLCLEPAGFLLIVLYILWTSVH